jgi:hypothetical protein
MGANWQGRLLVAIVACATGEEKKAAKSAVPKAADSQAGAPRVSVAFSQKV